MWNIKFKIVSYQNNIESLFHSDKREQMVLCNFLISLILFQCWKFDLNNFFAQIYRIDRSGGSTTTTPVRTLSETNRGVVDQIVSFVILIALFKDFLVSKNLWIVILQKLKFMKLIDLFREKLSYFQILMFKFLQNNVFLSVLLVDIPRNRHVCSRHVFSENRIKLAKTWSTS